MKILVTGGAGFIGSNCIRHLLTAYPSYSVVNLDKLTYAGNLENLEDVVREFPDRYHFIHGDIIKEEDVVGAAEGVDLIINFAAETHVDRSVAGPEAFLQTDIMGTHRLLEYVRAHAGVRYIQISTDEVYGSVPEGEADEQARFNPSSPYSASKGGGDLLCNAYILTYGLPIIVTHSANVFGPYQYPEKIIPLFITNILENKKVPLYGDGSQIREWIYVGDYASALDHIIHHGKQGEIYNIGTRERVANADLTRKILQRMDKDESWIQPVKDRPGHDARYAVTADKLNKLGWQAAVPFEEGLQKTIEWYATHEAWWKKIKSGDFWEFYKKNYKPL